MLDIFQYLTPQLANLPWTVSNRSNDELPMEADNLKLFYEYREFIMERFTCAYETNALYDTMFCWMDATVICSKMKELLSSEVSFPDKKLSMNGVSKLLLIVLISGKNFNLNRIMTQLEHCKLFGIQRIMIENGVLDNDVDVAEIIEDMGREALILLDREMNAEAYILDYTGLINEEWD